MRWCGVLVRLHVGMHMCMMVVVPTNACVVLAITSLAAMVKFPAPPLVIAQNGDFAVGVVVYLLLWTIDGNASVKLSSDQRRVNTYGVIIWQK